MKIIKFTLLSCLLITMMVACGEDFLEEGPLTKKTTGTYYLNSEEALEALTGCYDGLQLIYSEGGKALPVAATVMGDLTFGGTGNGDLDDMKMIDEHNKEVHTDANMYEINWKAYYTAIFRANTLLQQAEQTVEWEEGEEDLKASILAEAHFIRAFCYFDMVRLWGEVPLLTEPTVEAVPQASTDDIYKLIVDDLLYTIEYGSDQTYGDLKGHAGKWSAIGLLARAYLFYSGYYDNPILKGTSTDITKAVVLSYLEDLISNSGHGLVDNYYDLWPAASTYYAALNGKAISEATYAGENNEEIVFGIKYTYTSDWATSENKNINGNHWMVLNGLRNQSWAESGYGSGWGASTVVPELYAEWDDNDDRKAASIMAIEEEGIDYGATKVGDMKEYTGYFTKKYIPTCDSAGRSIAETVLGGVSFMISQFQDYFVLRYSDVLLMAAELGSPNAQAYADSVHFRATGVHLTAPLTQEELLEERKLEFAFEGIRYWDLLRSGLDYAADKISYNGTVLNGGVEEPKVIDGSFILTTKGLSQIPKNQITLTADLDKLSQNEGW